MTSAILAVIGLLTIWPKQELLSPEMAKTLTKMESMYQKQWKNPHIIGCENVDTSTGTGEVILVFECPKNIELFVYFNLKQKKRYRIRNYQNRLLVSK